MATPKLCPRCGSYSSVIVEAGELLCLLCSWRPSDTALPLVSPQLLRTRGERRVVA